MFRHKKLFISFVLSALVLSLIPIRPTRAGDFFIFSHNLRYGAINQEVKQLQKFLNANGFTVAKFGAGSKGKETYFFGAATRNALIKFQKANKIAPAIGFFGRITRNLINKKFSEPIAKAKPAAASNIDSQANNQNNSSLYTPAPPVVLNNSQPDKIGKSGYYSIGGSISGLAGAVTLENNGGDHITINPGDNSNFIFPTAIANGANYHVGAISKYSGQTCYVSNNLGVVNGADITNIKVACGQNLNYNPITFTPTAGVAKYTLTYAAGANGSITGASPQTVNSGSDAAAVTAVPDAGYSFANWSDGVSTAARTETGVISDKSVTAAFTANNNTITFNGNSSDGGSTAAQTLATAAAASLTANGFTKTGYAFAGWATTTEGAAAYADAASYTMGTASVTLYAKWTINNYTVTFNKNGGDTEANPTTRTADYNTTVTLPTAPTRTGYTFESWNTLANGLGAVFNASTAVTDNLTVYAKWTAAPTYALRDTGPGGGLVFYISDGGLHGLEAAPLATEWAEKQWGCYNTLISGADGTAIGTGDQNTTDIVNGCAEADRAAKLAYDLVSGGKSDWFLPSKDELNKMYINLKSGTDENSVVYTPVGGLDEIYFSSSEQSAKDAWYQDFYDGYQDYYYKYFSSWVRAVRAF